MSCKTPRCSEVAVQGRITSIRNWSGNGPLKIVPYPLRSALGIDNIRKRLPLRWFGWQDLNLRPSGPKPDALARLSYTQIISNMAPEQGIEPCPSVLETDALAITPHWYNG
jgi:hypothetical protein